MKLLVLLAVVACVASNPLPGDKICDVCKTGVQEIKDAFTDDKINKMKAVVGKVCAWIPFYDDCEDEATAVIDGVVSYIQAMDADKICSKIGECSAPAPVPTYVQFETCDACKARYAQVVDIVQKYPMIKKIVKTVLAPLCYVCPAENCSTVLDAIIDKIFDDFVAGADKVCTAMQLCDA